MEKPAGDRLLNAGLRRLATHGARGATTRSIEDDAGVPHGTLRHHFGNQDGFLRALTEHLLRLEAAPAEEAPSATVTRWLTSGLETTRARYELTLMASRDPELAELVVSARDTYVQRLVDGGVEPSRARLVVAAMDGVVFDGLLRGDTGAPLEALLALAAPETPRTSPSRRASPR